MSNTHTYTRLINILIINFCAWISKNDIRPCPNHNNNVNMDKELPTFLCPVVKYNYVRQTYSLCNAEVNHATGLCQKCQQMTQAALPSSDLQTLISLIETTKQASAIKEVWETIAKYNSFRMSIYKRVVKSMWEEAVECAFANNDVGAVEMIMKPIGRMYGDVRK